MRRLFNLRAFSGLSSSNGQRSKSKSLPIATIYGPGTHTTHTTNAKGTKNNSRVLTSKIDRSESANSSWWDREGGVSRSESEEYIVGNIGKDGKRDVPLEIWESRQVDVEVDRGSVSNTDVETGRGRPGGENGMGDRMRTKMYDGSGKEFESRTVVTAQVSSPLGRKSESGSRSS
ncbi:hypothetical protein BDZ45DRAFT_670974 [Acephala macrosclerotiorum]|nr:hypothetical protein BDZ45DRAFT_670974 [Acephala macrosclerotiorum]